MPVAPKLVRRDSDDALNSQEICSNGKTITTIPYGKGGGKAQVIKQGQIFQGRMQGGATRDQIYGTQYTSPSLHEISILTSSSDYGSGYPDGGDLRGTNGRGFPFYFWPVVWTNPFVVHSGDAYLHPPEVQYGLPDNTTRPGGQLSVLTYISNTPAATTFHVLTDFTTATSLIVNLNPCALFLDLSSALPMPYLQYAVTPLPEQAIQYYRASSAVLTLDGYNNTAVLFPQGSTPSYNPIYPGDTDLELLQCLNTTIGSAILLNQGPQGLSDGAIIFIVLGCAIALVNPLASPTLSSTVSPPPPARVAMPQNGEPLSSGKAGEWSEEDDLPCLTKYASPSAGAKGGSPGNNDSRGGQTPRSWVSFGKRDKTEVEHIEMAPKR
ncbi:hypothetical protein C0991_011836 [Blastosporella zonata]|nr:hypothetical protein C0991_011836 [Blastosporella zonata]